MEILSAENLKEYDDFMRSSPKGNFAQSPNWAKVKTAWTPTGVMVRDDSGRICGAMSLLIRKLPVLPFSMAYACRGPVCDVHDEAVVTALVRDAKALAKQHHAYVLKIDPDVPASDTAFLALLKKLGFTCKPQGKNFEGIQPRFVFRKTIAGMSEEEVLASFHSKHRYNIRVALKKGVEVKIAPREELKTFYEIMLETGMRDNFVTRPLAYFERMYDALGEDIRLYMAYYEGKPIAGTLAIHYGDKVWYLYGASSNSYRNVMPNYLLQWEMMRWAIAEGCRIYDFRGVSGDMDESNPLYGLYRFKKGFEGDLVEFVGEFDLILNPLVYHAVDKGQKLYKRAIKAAYKLKNRSKAPDRTDASQAATVSQQEKDAAAKRAAAAGKQDSAPNSGEK